MMTGPVKCPGCGEAVGHADVEDEELPVLLVPYPNDLGDFAIILWDQAVNKFTVRRLPPDEYRPPGAMLWSEHECAP